MQSSTESGSPSMSRDSSPRLPGAIHRRFPIGVDGFSPIGTDLPQMPEIEVAIADFEPGTMQVLNEGEGVTFSNPADVGGSYEAFQYRNLLAIAAACGVPYAALTGDPSKGNFSSQRSISNSSSSGGSRSSSTRRSCSSSAGRSWARWIATAALSGSISGLTPGVFNRGRAALSTVRWMPPKWDWVDPLKDLKADELAIRMGILPRSDAIEPAAETPPRSMPGARKIRPRRRFGLRLDGGTVDEPAPPPEADAAEAA